LLAGVNAVAPQKHLLSWLRHHPGLLSSSFVVVVVFGCVTLVVLLVVADVHVHVHVQHHYENKTHSLGAELCSIGQFWPPFQHSQLSHNSFSNSLSLSPPLALALAEEPNSPLGCNKGRQAVNGFCGFV